MLEVPPPDHSPDATLLGEKAHSVLNTATNTTSNITPDTVSNTVSNTTADTFNVSAITNTPSGTTSLQPQQDESVLKGTVRRILFRNPSNLYSVLEVTLDGKNEKATVVGSCIQIREQDEILAHGKFIHHPKFGYQFNASIIERLEPSSAEGIAKYLGSGLIKGIGLRTAQRIVKEFGDETFEIIHRKPNLVANIPGVGKHKAELVRQAFHAESTVRKIIQFLVSHGITPSLASKIYARYKESTVEIITSNPYLLARDLKGVGFRTADVIATDGFKLATDAPERLRAGISFALEQASEDGHCYLPENELIQRAAALLGINEIDKLHAALNYLIDEESIISQSSGVYLTQALSAEKFIANFIRERVGSLKVPVVNKEKLTKSLIEAEKALGISFSSEQQMAVEAAMSARLLLITGGPGCGKTTIIRALSHSFNSLGKKLCLTAPTGRAAQRMAQVCDLPASTIHRLLRFNRGKFEYCAQNPLPVDVIIVDEASMIDIYLAKSLFSAIPTSALLVLVGDKDQLPSVGPGRVFADLIAAQNVKTMRLSRLFRRNEHSTINDIAHHINMGLMPHIPKPDGQTKVDAYFLQEKDPEETSSLIVKLVSEQLPKKFGLETSDIMVLTPSNRGPLGVKALNIKLQERLNPVGSRDESQEITIGLNNFRLGDRVVQRVNNYQIHDAGVFNGDSGVIFAINREKKSLKVDLWDGRIIDYSEIDAQQLTLCYAMTVHRSQGTEIPCVVLVLHDSHYNMLERQLIYTAVTRAKKLLIVVGTKRALAIASRKSTASNRYTGLKELVEKE
jgi:exodeoxyribonuclease V alpha subunit